MDKENKGRKIDSDIAKSFWIACVLSVLFVVGIPLIIVSAVKGITVALIFGIAFVVIGFYGMPFAWMSFGNLRSLRRVVDAVTEENLTTNAEVASQLQISEKVAKESISKAINKKYITGYLYDGAKLTPNEKQAPKKKIVLDTHTCSRCGAPMNLTENNMACPYCGAKYNKQ